MKENNNVEQYRTLSLIDFYKVSKWESSMKGSEYEIRLLLSSY